MWPESAVLVNKLPFSIGQPAMPVFAIPEALQTEEGKCSEVLKDTDRAPEGKCAEKTIHFLGDKNPRSPQFPPRKCLRGLPITAGEDCCLGTFKEV